MGLSVYLATYVGFRVEPFDLWDTEYRQVATCQNGHPQKGEASYCDQDGTKFERRPMKKPTAAFRALVHYLGWTEGTTEREWQRLYEDLRDGEHLRNVNVFTSAEDRHPNLAVTVKLHDSSHSSNDTGPCPLSFNTISNAVEHLEKIRDLMGLKIEVQIFPSCYLSW